MNNYLRITFLDYGAWLFTDLNKAVNFLHECMKKYGNLNYRYDILTKDEIATFHHDYQFCQLERIDCTLDDFDEAVEAIKKNNVMLGTSHVSNKED